MKTIKKEEYVVYVNWGFEDVYMNLIYSYIKGFKDGTYVSNAKLSSLFGCSGITIKRKLKELEDGGYIVRFYSQNNRFRIMKTSNKKIKRVVSK